MSPDYVAGLFDGEGCIGIYGNQLRVEITGCYLPTFEALVDHFGYGACYSQKYREFIVPDHHKQKYRFVIQNKARIKEFLDYIKHSVYEKRYQVDTALMYLNGNLTRELTDQVLRQAKKQNFEIPERYMPKERKKASPVGPAQP